MSALGVLDVRPVDVRHLGVEPSNGRLQGRVVGNGLGVGASGAVLQWVDVAFFGPVLGVGGELIRPLEVGSVDVLPAQLVVPSQSRLPQQLGKSRGGSSLELLELSRGLETAALLMREIPGEKRHEVKSGREGDGG